VYEDPVMRPSNFDYWGVLLVKVFFTVSITGHSLYICRITGSLLGPLFPRYAFSGFVYWDATDDTCQRVPFALELICIAMF